MRIKGSPTIVDVARMAGVSKSTVARVLSNNGIASAETQRRVWEAAEAIGYVRNQLAAGLRSGETGTIGLVVPDIANDFWADVARGAQHEAERINRSLFILSSDWNTCRGEQQIAALRRARVDGIIFNALVLSSDFSVLDNVETPVVVIGSSYGGLSRFSSVRADLPHGVQQAMSHLANAGHRRVALLIGSSKHVADLQFISTAQRFCQERGYDSFDLVVEEGGYTVASGEAAMLRLLKRGDHRTTAVLARNDQIALGALQACRAKGFHCPHDISIMGMDGIEFGRLCHPGLTTVYKPRHEIGVEATRLVADRFEGAQPARHRVFPCLVVERGSVSAPRGA